MPKRTRTPSTGGPETTPTQSVGSGSSQAKPNDSNATKAEQVPNTATSDTPLLDAASNAAGGHTASDAFTWKNDHNEKPEYGLETSHSTADGGVHSTETSIGMGDEVPQVKHASTKEKTENGVTNSTSHQVILGEDPGYTFTKSSEDSMGQGSETSVGVTTEGASVSTQVGRTFENDPDKSEDDVFHGTRGSADVDFETGDVTVEGFKGWNNGGTQDGIGASVSSNGDFDATLTKGGNYVKVGQSEQGTTIGGGTTKGGGSVTVGEDGGAASLNVKRFEAHGEVRITEDETKINMGGTASTPMFSGSADIDYHGYEDKLSTGTTGDQFATRGETTRSLDETDGMEIGASGSAAFTPYGFTVAEIGGYANYVENHTESAGTLAPAGSELWTEAQWDAWKAEQGDRRRALSLTSPMGLEDQMAAGDVLSDTDRAGMASGGKLEVIEGLAGVSNDTSVMSSTTNTITKTEDGGMRGSSVDAVNLSDQTTGSFLGTDWTSGSFTEMAHGFGFIADPGTDGAKAMIEMKQTGLLPGGLAYAEADEDLEDLAELYRIGLEEAQASYDKLLEARTDKAGLEACERLEADIEDGLEIAKKAAAGINAAYRPTINAGDTPVDGLLVQEERSATTKGTHSSQGGLLADEKKESTTTTTSTTDYVDGQGEVETAYGHNTHNYWDYLDDTSVSITTTTDEEGLAMGFSSVHKRSGHGSSLGRDHNAPGLHEAWQDDNLGYKQMQTDVNVSHDDMELIADKLNNETGVWKDLVSSVDNYWQVRANLNPTQEALSGLDDDVAHFTAVPNPIAPDGVYESLFGSQHDKDLAKKLSAVKSAADFDKLSELMQVTFIATAIQHSTRTGANPFDAIAAIGRLDNDKTRALAYRALAVAAEKSLAINKDTVKTDLASEWWKFRSNRLERTGGPAYAAARNSTTVDQTDQQHQKMGRYNDAQLTAALERGGLAGAFTGNGHGFLSALRRAEETGRLTKLVEDADINPEKVKMWIDAAKPAEQAYIRQLLAGTSLKKTLDEWKLMGELDQGTRLHHEQKDWTNDSSIRPSGTLWEIEEAEKEKLKIRNERGASFLSKLKSEYRADPFMCQLTLNELGWSGYEMYEWFGKVPDTWDAKAAVHWEEIKEQLHTIHRARWAEAMVADQWEDFEADVKDRNASDIQEFLTESDPWVINEMLKKTGATPSILTAIYRAKGWSKDQLVADLKGTTS